MERDVADLTDPIVLLQHYQALCNRYDIAAAVALFADDGCIEIRGTAHCGPVAVRALHECDMGSQTQVAFSDYAVVDGSVTCTFVTTDVLDRAVGLDGRHMRAVFTIQNGRILRFVSLPADEPERQRHAGAKQAFFKWARTHYPDEVAKGANLDYEAGMSLTRVVEAWLAVHDRATTDTAERR